MPAGAETAHAEERRITLVGAVVNLALAVAKGIGGWLGGSQALLADAVHSLSDLFTDAVTWMGLLWGGRRADEDHHFGHGRIQTMAALVAALVLLSVSAGMCWQAVKGLLGGRSTRPGWMVLALAAASVVAKELLYRFTMRLARKNRSLLLQANAWHHRSDALSSVAVLAGWVMIHIRPRWGWLDGVVALVVAGWVIKVGASLLWAAVGELCDRAPDPQVISRISACIDGVDGVMGSHDVKVRTVGGRLQMHAHVVVDGNLSVRDGHRIADEVRACLKRDIEGIDEVTVHVDPHDESKGS